MQTSGILTILRRAKSIFPDDPLYLVIGGFHLVNANKKQISEIIDGFKTLGVQKVAPCHCSGDETGECSAKLTETIFTKSGGNHRNPITLTIKATLSETINEKGGSP